MHVLVLAGALAAPSVVGLTNATAAPLTASPQIETLLASGLGDDGPAAEALVNATRMSRAVNGDLLLRDTTGLGTGYYYDVPHHETAGTFRRVRDGVITTANFPALPETARGDAVIEDVFLRGSAAIYVLRGNTERRVVRVDASGDRELVKGNANDGGSLLAVGNDGSLVWSRYRYDAVTGVHYATELVSPDGTSARRLTDYTSSHAAIADDGTVFLSHYQPANAETGAGAGLGIERIGLDGTLDVVAGPGPALDRSGVRPEGIAATAAVISPRRLAVSPDGTQVAFSDVTPRGNYLLRAFTVGGEIRTVAGSDALNKSYCRSTTPALLAEADAVLAACGGIRSFSYDGTTPAAGTMVAGLNALPGLLDSPSGTPTARAYLSRVRDLAYDPQTHRIAIATAFGAAVIDGTELVRVLDTGEDERIPEPNRADSREVDIAYGPDGTLFMFAPDPADPTTNVEARRWRLRSRAPGGSPVEVAAGRGSTLPADGVVLANASLKRGRIAVSASGNVYLTQAQTVYRVDDGVLRKVADVVEQYVPVISRLAFDPAGRLLVTGGRLHRLDADGKLRQIDSPPGNGLAVGSDGSVYSEDWHKIWRQKPDGSTVVALGRYPEEGVDPWYHAPTTPPVGVELGSSTTAIEALPDGRIAVADSKPTAGLMLVRPAEGTWTGPAPTLTLTSSTKSSANGPAGTVRVQVDVPAGGPAWRVQLRVAIAAVPPTLNGGTPLTATRLQPGESYATTFTRYDDGGWVSTEPYRDTYLFKPGQQVSVALWSWVGDASVGVPRIARTITVPDPTLPTVTLTGPRVVARGQAATIHGVLRLEGAALPGEGWAIESRPVGTDAWTSLFNGLTDDHGAFDARVFAPRATEFRVLHSPGGNQAPVYGTIRIDPSYVVTAKPQYNWRKQAIVIRGGVVPRGKGTKLILEQGRKSGGVWHWTVVDRSVVRAQGAFELTMPVAQQSIRTTWFFRVRVPATAVAGAGSSPRLRFSVPPKTS